MSIYFLDTTTGVYRLDATTTVTKTMRGRASENVIESGETTSDNYVNLPDKFNMVGVISDITSIAGSTRDAEGFITGLTKVKEEGEIFTLYMGFAVARAPQCVIENFELSQDKVNGYANGSNSFKVKLNIKKLRFSEEILITQTRDPKFSDSYQEKQEGAGSATEAPPKVGAAAELALANSYFEAADTGIAPGE